MILVPLSWFGFWSLGEDILFPVPAGYRAFRKVPQGRRQTGTRVGVTEGERGPKINVEFRMWRREERTISPVIHRLSTISRQSWFDSEGS